MRRLAVGRMSSLIADIRAIRLPLPKKICEKTYIYLRFVAVIVVLAVAVPNAARGVPIMTVEQFTGSIECGINRPGYYYYNKSSPGDQSFDDSYSFTYGEFARGPAHWRVIHRTPRTTASPRPGW